MKHPGKDIFRDKKEKERLLKDKIQREKLIERMKNDLTSLKKKKVELVKQAKQDQKKFAKLKQEKDKEIKEWVYISDARTFHITWTPVKPVRDRQTVARWSQK